MSETKDRLSLVVVGASGDLARKKIYPALFALYCQGFLPEEFGVFGFARSELGPDEFRARMRETLSCRYDAGQGGAKACEEEKNAFLARCTYLSGEYDAEESLLRLEQELRRGEGGGANRIFYLAVPPAVFSDVTRAIGRAGMAGRADGVPWTRLVVEKPFGRDRASSDLLVEDMRRVFSEEQTYRIDHYLGKEVIQNLLVLRFANVIFEPLWDRLHIEAVRVVWEEDIGVGDRAGYFDNYGIIRDVMQNHLLQIVALVAMERPKRLGEPCVRDEKVKLLRSIEPVCLKHVALGQYAAAVFRGGARPGYLEEKGIPPGSLTPTFAAAVLRIGSPRWEGVPFLLRAGKGLKRRAAEVHIRFHEAPGNIFCPEGGCLPPNRLVIRIQPDEAISFQITNKVPGLRMELAQSDLDLRYARAYDCIIPDAYESLLLDVIRGDRSLFIRQDELAASWDVFTPVLREIEERKIDPEPYPFGSAGPSGAADLAARFGTSWA